MGIFQWYHSLFSVVLTLGLFAATTRSETLEQALHKVTIPNSDDVRGYITLPETLDDFGEGKIKWTSSRPDIVSDKHQGKVAPGIVRRPPPGSQAVNVILTACVRVRSYKTCRDFHIKVQPSVRLAETSRYGMVNFARSNSQSGQQIYMASSVGNDATSWTAVNQGNAVFTSNKGMHGLRDPSIVRSPEGDKFYLVATDLNVDGIDYGWIDWNWAQSNASRYIEVWESQDLRTWSKQRHILVAPLEAGMAYAPEAIWDREIGAYVVYWTSSLYREGTYYTPNITDPNGRYPLTRNQILYATTRDFIVFSPAKVMSGRRGHGTLDAVITHGEDGTYHRFVCDRTSTGNATQYVPCGSEDIYQEQARSILAAEDEWEVVSGCITHKMMNTTYAEAPLVVRANPSDPRGKGYYLYADQKWDESPAGDPLEEQLQPYWTKDLISGNWSPIAWTQKPEYDFAKGVIRHGSIIPLTTAEHAAWRRAELTTISVTKPPHKTDYVRGESLDLDGLRIEAIYSDGIIDDELHEGYGGYTLSGFDSDMLGTRIVTVSYTVVNVTRTSTFKVDVHKRNHRH